MTQGKNVFKSRHFRARETHVPSHFIDAGKTTPHSGPERKRRGQYLQVGKSKAGVPWPRALCTPALCLLAGLWAGDERHRDESPKGLIKM